MSPPDFNKPRRWRRVFWYSLTVFVLTLIGLYAFAFWRFEQQQAAIAEIERLGGSVKTERGGLEWLRDFIGDGRMKVFDRVAFVDLNHTEITDDGLRHVSDLTNLKLLYLADTQVTGNGLKHLSGLTNLEGLRLDDTQVTDGGLPHLIGLTNIRDLWLDHTQITDDDLRHLSGLTSLEILGLPGTQITDDGLSYLTGLTNLKTLNLANTQITNQGEMILQKALPNCDIYR